MSEPRNTSHGHTGEDDTFGDSMILLNLFIVRHSTQLVPIFVQCLQLLASGLIICGVIYFIVFVFILAFHHFFYDPTLELMPEFVHLNQLPKSEDGSFDEDESESLEYYEEIIERRRLQENRFQSRPRQSRVSKR